MDFEIRAVETGPRGAVIDYSVARKRELELKKQKGGEGFYKLVGRSFEQLTHDQGKPSGS
jgi:hypothetical protein